MDIMRIYMFTSKISSISNIFKEDSNETSTYTETQQNIDTKTRINKYDNLKGFAIILVVLGHIMLYFTDFPIYNNLYTFFNLFHMPIFFFVAGYFSKVDKNSSLNAFKTLMIPFFVFSIFWYVFTYFLNGNIPKVLFIFPAPGLWFLLALFLMKVLLPIFIKIKHIFWVSVIAALLVGICNTPDNILAFTRFLCFTPVFLVGYYYKHSKSYFDSLNYNLKKIMITIRNFLNNNKTVLFIILIISLIIIDIVLNYVLSGRYSFKMSYAALHQGIKIGILERFFAIAAGIILTLLFTLAMTNKKSFLTKLGRNSLAIYLLHFYFRTFSEIFLVKTSLGQLIADNMFFSGSYIISITIIILIILSPNIINDSIRKMSEYIWDIFSKEQLID